MMRQRRQEERFYPPEIAPFAHEPLRADFVIEAAGQGRGEGLKALRSFAPGDVVFAFTGDIIGEITQYTLQLDDGRHIHDPYVMGKVLHHCAPNCHVDLDRLCFVALRAIAAGDYVTMDYCQTEDVLYKPFVCRCGAPACRGYIGGRGAGLPELVSGFILEAEQRIAALDDTGSRYAHLVALAAVGQQLGNALSDWLYAAQATRAVPPLACGSGCTACCSIPYTVPQVTTTDFTMSLLDVITLVEGQAQVKAPVLPATVIASNGVQPTLPCPQLAADGGCTIYEFRPVTCKIWISADAGLCASNRDNGYRVGHNPLTDASDRLRLAFEAPFAGAVARQAESLAFRGYDFLDVFRRVQALAATCNGLDAFRAGIDAGMTVAEAFACAAYLPP